jgi:hypothetical protein
MLADIKTPAPAEAGPGREPNDSAPIVAEPKGTNKSDRVRIPVELRIEIVNRSDRDAYSWAYLTRGVPSPRAICVALNRNCWVTARALSKTDIRLLKLLVAQCLFDRLSRDRWLAAVLEAFEAELVPEGCYADTALLATRAVKSPRFAVLPRLPIYGETPTASVRYFISTISTLMRKRDAAKPWPRPSKKKEGHS